MISLKIIEIIDIDKRNSLLKLLITNTGSVVLSPTLVNCYKFLFRNFKKPIFNLNALSSRVILLSVSTIQHSGTELSLIF